MTNEMHLMQVSAPAKINLSLKILGVRKDGFHDIETLLAPISLCDEIAIKKQPRWIDFSCDDPSLPSGDDNLAVRAAKLFFANGKVSGGVSIALKKKIPYGAGLGGGSSDAAAVLFALNELFEARLSREQLTELGSVVGSDVPFFLFQSAAICKGRGEIVQPVKMKEQLSVLLLKPAFRVSTAWAYSRWKNSRDLPGISYGPQEFAGQNLVNDLEHPVFEKYVFLARLKMWLLEQAEIGAALMSGSGSTVFAVVRPNADVDLVAQRARAELDLEIWTCACQTLEGAAPAAP
jgi:4-diphosphocytidyl-2-C-methyl-D-erythritol kinase